MSPLPDDCEGEIKKLIDTLQDDLASLESINLEEKVKRLEDEKLNLEHRTLLSGVLPQVVEYVEAQKWALKAGEAGGSTRHITQKHNQLFEELVTGRYIEQFRATLVALGRPIRVKVKTSGKKGETLKQIVLEADRSTADLARPEKVLSEGEKRAVALADFLTEVSLDEGSSGVILDDPVTSLDLDWRLTIARMLVNQCKGRQVIVFTHDLPFLYYLKEYADKDGIPIETHWIKRGVIDDKPGYVDLNNSPALEREYRKPTVAKGLYNRAIKASAAEQELLLKAGFSALRTSYEAFIVFDLLNEVVMRFDERISFGRLKEIAWDTSIVEDVIRKCEELSQLMEGHLHSDALGAKKPDPKALLDEIQFFEAVRKRLESAKKAVH